MAVALLGLGANLGDRAAQLDAAVEQLDDQPGIEVLRQSRWYETAPVGGPPGQQAFLNGAALIETTLEPAALLQVLERIEHDAGRKRHQRWDARTLDVDLLLYGQRVINTQRLQVPHPRMIYRRFVLEPAAEIAAEQVHPTTGWTLGELLNHLNQHVDYVALAGLPCVGKTRLAREVLSNELGWLIEAPREPAGCAFPWAGSPLSELPLECLRHRAPLLVQADWPPVQATAVSDFWFDQMLVAATVWLSGAELETYHQAWQELRAQVVEPKLTIVLDAPAAVVLKRLAEGSHPARDMVDEEELEQLRAALLSYAGTPGVGPVLVLDATQPELARSEIEAALVAMK